eukprot:403347935
MILKLAKVSIPAMISQMFAFFMEIVNLFFIGHLNDPAKVAGVGLGNMYVNIVSQSIIIGLNGGIGTLVSQAYGQRNFRKCGVYLNRGRVVVIAAFIPMIMMILMCERVLLFIGQSPQAASYAGIYVKALIPGMFFHAQFDATRQYLISMHRTLLVSVTMTTTSLLHMFWCYILVNTMQLGVLGTSLAMMISYTLNFSLLTMFCLASSDLKTSFFFFTKETWEDFKEYLMIGIPSAVMLCLEWGGFELLIIIAGLISIEVSGAQVVLLNTFFVIMMLSLGLQQGAMACVGKAMGEGNSKKARIYLKMAVSGSIFMNLIIAFVTSIFRTGISRLFTTNPALVAQIFDVVNIMSLAMVFTGIQLILEGGIRGLGLQTIATVIVLICMYLICIPASYIFAISFGFKLRGIWFGLIVGMISLCLVYTYILTCRTSWKKMAYQISHQMSINRDSDKAPQLRQYMPIPQPNNKPQHQNEFQKQTKYGKVNNFTKLLGERENYTSIYSNQNECEFQDIQAQKYVSNLSDNKYKNSRVQTPSKSPTKQWKRGNQQNENSSDEEENSLSQNINKYSSKYKKKTKKNDSTKKALDFSGGFGFAKGGSGKKYRYKGDQGDEMIQEGRPMVI